VICCHNANLRRSWNWINFVLIIGTLIIYPLFLMAYSFAVKLVPEGATFWPASEILDTTLPYYGHFFDVAQNSQVWMLILFIVIVCFCTDLLIKR
jgi:hypothetical protein